MDEILEGEVGRSFRFRGEEYWAREADPITPQAIFNLQEAMDRCKCKPYLYYGTYTQVNAMKSFLLGITEV